MVPKTQHLPSPARERDKEQETGEEIFFPPKKSQTTELFGSIGLKTKKRHNNTILKKNVISNKNKHKKGKVCFRTDKKLSEKKRTKPKTNGFWSRQKLYLTMT
jgi:hypothetical protein